jgi:hypothetical protein
MAAGSRGGELAVYAAEVIGQELLPWQAAVADELLTVDADGRWCRTSALIVVPRQSGKSTLLRALCEWLAVQGQVVMTASAKLSNVAHLMRPTQHKYRSVDGYHVLFSKDQPEVNWPGWDEDSSRWIGQAANAMFGRGFTVTTAVLDESQDVAPVALESVSPALVEVDNPLIVMTGTAPRTSEANVLHVQRALALEGGPVTLFEWSAPEGSDWRDETVWRASSPRWTPARLRHLRGEVAKGDEQAFRTEYLCQPAAGAGEPWLDIRAWRASRLTTAIPDRVEVAAVEDGRGGLGGSVALAWSHDGLARVVAMVTPSLDEAWRLAARAERVLCGITLRNEQPAKDLRAKPCGTKETSTALPELRRLLAVDGLRWDGDDLDAQMRAAKVHEDANGSLRVGSGTPTGALRCAAWAVQSVRITSEPVLV